MTQATRLPNASSTLTRSFERTGEGVALNPSSVPEPCKVFAFGDYLAPAAETPVRHVAIGDLVARWEARPDRKAAIARARGWVADALHADDGVTVRTLRMRKGLSQQQLAEAIGTSQPHIARIERGMDNLNIDTCRRLVRVLEVDMNTLDGALLQQQKNNDKKVP